MLFSDMREASRRLTQSLFDAYDPDWVGEEDLGGIVEVSEIVCPKIKAEQPQNCRNNKTLVLPTYFIND